MKIFVRAVLILIVIFGVQNSHVSAATNEEKAFLLVQEGQALFKQKKYKEALECFKQVNLSEKYSDIMGAMHFLMGNCYSELADHKKSIEYYKLVLQNPPTFGKKDKLSEILYATNYCISKEYFLLEDFDNAISYSSKSIEINPRAHADPYVIRGGAYFQKGMFQQALDDLNIAVEIDPQNNYFRAMRRGMIEQIKMKERSEERQNTQAENK